MRLIVLSKTHAWGQKLFTRGTNPSKRPHMRFDLSLPDNDVFTRSILSIPAFAGTDEPFHSRCHETAAAYPWGEPKRKLIAFRDRVACFGGW
jgi:hypothetical protein